MIEPASESSIPAIARLYQAAFPEALMAVFGRPSLPEKVVEDVFSLLYRYEKQGLQVAIEDSQVIGFILSFSDRDRFLRNSLLDRMCWRFIGRVLIGHYPGMGFHFVPNLMKAAWDYRQPTRIHFWETPVAQILSIVIDPAYQGRGIGKSLLQSSLNYLKTTPAKTVRLEVDAAKKGPHSLYEKLGFRDVGEVLSPRGQASVMSLSLKP